MANLTTIFKPDSVAVIGASKKKGKIGNVVLKNIIDSGYKGKIYPVNPKEDEIEGLKNYRSLDDIPGKVDLAVISIPAAGVLQATEECGKKGVKNIIILSAGFKEVGKEGLELEKKVTKTCKKYGINLLGPNCVGLIDTHTPLNATFGHVFPKSGNIAFLSQSGAMLLAILDWSMTTGIGFSKAISVGNKADISEIDLIKNLGDDPDSSVILCYIEDIVSGEEFLKAAAETTRKKPVIILKSGASQAGARAASSHTGALAGSDLAYDTAFRQTGVIRAHNMTELFDLALAFSKLPLPKGDRVAVITNAGGGGIVTADSIEKNGLNMARFTKATIEELQKNLPAESSIYNPVDVLGDASPDRYKFTLEKVSADPNVDSIIVLTCPTGITKPLEISKAIIEVKNSRPDKPFFGVCMGGVSLADSAEMLRKEGIPSYVFPETAVEALKGMTRYTQYKNAARSKGSLNFNNTNKNNVKAVFYDVIKDHRLVLLGSEAAEVVRSYGIPAAPTVLTKDADEAVSEAEKIGYPVVLKVASPKIQHKTDVGGVKVGLKSAKEVRAGFEEILENINRFFPQATVHGIEVQKLMPKGRELIIGMTRDVQFGPMIAFGMGGIYVNLLKDVSFRLARGLSKEEIEAMISETKVYALLKGYRGEKPADINAIKDVIARVAKLTLDFPEITEMDINPVFVYQEGLSALDVKITIS